MGGKRAAPRFGPPNHNHRLTRLIEQHKKSKLIWEGLIFPFGPIIGHGPSYKAIECKPWDVVKNSKTKFDKTQMIASGVKIPKSGCRIGLSWTGNFSIGILPVIHGPLVSHKDLIGMKVPQFKVIGPVQKERPGQTFFEPTFIITEKHLLEIQINRKKGWISFRIGSIQSPLKIYHKSIADMSIPLLLAATFRFNQPGKMTLIGKRKLLKEVIIFLFITTRNPSSYGNLGPNLYRELCAQNIKPPVQAFISLGENQTFFNKMNGKRARGKRALPRDGPINHNHRLTRLMVQSKKFKLIWEGLIFPFGPIIGHGPSYKAIESKTWDVQDSKLKLSKTHMVASGVKIPKSGCRIALHCTGVFSIGILTVIKGPLVSHKDLIGMKVPSFKVIGPVQKERPGQTFFEPTFIITEKDLLEIQINRKKGWISFRIGSIQSPLKIYHSAIADLSIPLILAATFRFNLPGKMTLIGKRKLLKEIIIFLFITTRNHSSYGNLGPNLYRELCAFI